MYRSRARISWLLLVAGQWCSAAEYAGQVKFGGLPVPGVTVTVVQGERRVVGVTDGQGNYRLTGLADGAAQVELEMLLFRKVAAQVTLPAAAAEWGLELAGTEEFAKVPLAPKGNLVQTAVAAAPAGKGKKDEAPVAAEFVQRAADGFLINGSVNNGAASAFAQLPAFGNNRRGARSMYNGNIGLIWNNAAFDARAYSLTGQNTVKPAYNRAQALLAFGGPLKIPGLIKRNGPVVTVNYQWTRNTNAAARTGLMPVEAERAGDFRGLGKVVRDPVSGLPFAGNVIPASRVTAAGRGLMGLYPLPNFVGSSRYNYQVPLVNGLHQDDLQTRVTKQKRKHYFAGNFAAQSTRTDATDLFGFLDTGRVLGLNAGLSYRRLLNGRTFVTVGTQFSRLRTETRPYFSGKRNVSGELGIGGNNQEAVNWGPPNLNFASGVTDLVSAQAAELKNQTGSVSADLFLNSGRHNWTAGVTYRRQQFNVLAQQDARGTFTFTGAAAGHDVAGLLLGVPDTSAIAFGNADKYLRGRVVEAFANDDWRVAPGLTVNAGVRWEYWTPLEEKFGRLVNLDTGSGFGAAIPVVAAAGKERFPRPDRNNVGPRVGIAWRPLTASSLIVRAGYGMYYDTSVYQGIMMRMAQQAPLSQSLRVENSAGTPLTLAAGFPRVAAGGLGTTFAVDPGLRIGLAQTWQASAQRDLPGGLQMTATYLGSKGTRGQQQILPNTFPGGAVGAAGYTYLMSNGLANRHAGQMQVRRRLRNGLTASVNYTFAKAIDNSALGGRNAGGAMIAQDWRNLRAERALSNFDQRHVVQGMVQYTTGMGVKGGALATGKKAVLWKEWTMSAQLNAGSGLPLTPLVLNAVRGTGVTGTLRPDYTGAGLYDAPAGLALNPAAVALPVAGQWGNAGRNSIRGPEQLVVNAAVGRTFRSTERVSVDFRVEAANALNHPTYPGWNTVVGNAQFGLPMTANPMRTVQAVLRTRF